MRDDRRARDVDDLVAVEGRERARLVQCFAEAIEDRLREHRERRRRQVAVRKGQHPRAQIEPPRLVGGDEAQRRQRVQAAPCRGARNARAVADLRDRHAPLLVGERQQHREPARQGGDEIGIIAMTGDGIGQQRVRVGQRCRRLGRGGRKRLQHLRLVVDDGVGWHEASDSVDRNMAGDRSPSHHHVGRTSPVQYNYRPQKATFAEKRRSCSNKLGD